MIEAEALVATTGLWPSKAPSQRTIVAASGILRSWAGKLSSFLDGRHARFNWPPPPEPSKLQDDILSIPDQEEIAGWFENMLDPQLAIEYVTVITRGREYLAAQWPHVQMEGIVAEVLPPSKDQLDRMWALTRTLDDPDSIFEDMQAYALTSSQAEAFRKVYPELAGMADRIAEDQIIRKISKNERIQWTVESQIRTFKLMPQLVPIAVTQPKNSEQPKPPETTIDFEKYKTPAEKRRL